jgi:hypothetical protein
MYDYTGAGVYLLIDFVVGGLLLLITVGVLMAVVNGIRYRQWTVRPTHPLVARRWRRA